MKKIFTLFLALAVSVGTMFAESGTCGDNLTWDLTDGVLTISGSGAMTNYDYWEEKAPWYMYCSSITEVSIGNSVTSIGKCAFCDCTGLTSITIPNSVTSIGESAFYGCAGLTSVTIGDSVTSIEWGAFEDCTSLTSVTIGNSVTSIESTAFYGCTDLTSITIPNSVTSIGTGAFSGCSGLTSIVVESGNISYDSRDNCNAIIESATNTLISGCQNSIIPNSVTSIGKCAFEDCTGLTSITIPNSVTSIGGSAFSGCAGLTSVTIGNSVTSIGDYAFYGCTGLTSVDIPNSVTSIEHDAFSDCTGLTSIVVESGNISYDSRDNCNAIIESATNTLISGCQNSIIPNSVTSIGESAFSGSGLTSITIPNSVKSIGWGAFRKCICLTSVTIGNRVRSIGEKAFGGCTGLTSIYNYRNTPQEIENNVFYDVNTSICKLYVPTGSVNAYKDADVWEYFNILPISAEEKTVDVVEVETTESTVSIAWPQVDNAYTYELVIKDQNGNVICTFIFNSQGQLISMAFNAPAFGDAPQNTQTAGFAFTITGLDSGTTYRYTITTKNASGTVLKEEEGSFTTKSNTPFALDNIEAGNKSTKILRNGHILIHNGNKTYTIMGQHVK